MLGNISTKQTSVIERFQTFTDDQTLAEIVVASGSDACQMGLEMSDD